MLDNSTKYYNIISNNGNAVVEHFVNIENSKIN
ncbi:hypothetical protein Catovirus_1_86 [Catovirus CTV1]|uniref:Uncharacterized protein n=1 Tax=Catovirus CTV1 TaxID=1977631 RepID=A0A1V0S8L6_9VIRU|nr:hypothetical protein Catovirus_1_86 [Catovirus CTV1]